MNRAHHSRTDPICQSASQKRCLRIDRAAVSGTIGPTKRQKVPGARRGPAGRIGKRVRGPRGTAAVWVSAGSSATVGRGPMGRRTGGWEPEPEDLPAGGYCRERADTPGWSDQSSGENLARPERLGPCFCCLTPLFRMSGERCFSKPRKKGRKTDENPKEVPCSSAGHDPDRGSDCVLRRNGQPERPVRLQQPHPGGEAASPSP